MADQTTDPNANANGNGNSNANNNSNSNNKPATADTGKQLQAISDEIADTPRPTKDDPIELQREYREKMNELSKKAAALRKKQIKEDSNLSEDEKKVLAAYDAGKQVFVIAKEVYKFANGDTVGQVMLIIRKAHADDWDEVEDVKSTKGYTGIGVNA